MSCDAALALEEHFSESVPKGVTVEVDRPAMRRASRSYRGTGATLPGEFRARWRWWRTYYVFLTLFALVWNGSLLVALTSGGTTWFDLLCSGAHLAAGVILTWAVLGGWLNRTTVEVRDGRLSCQHGPIVWPLAKPRPVHLSEVVRFEVASRSDVKEDTRSWRVDAHMRDGEKVAVIPLLDQRAVAQFLCRRLERQLESWREPKALRVRVGELEEEVFERLARSREREV